MILKKFGITLIFVVSIMLFSACNLYNSEFGGYNSDYFKFNDEFYIEETSTDTNSFDDEMKIEKNSDIDLNKAGGADLYERKFDHEDSRYFNNQDFYNMKSNKSLKILHNFKTYQQTGENSSGEACILAVLEWYGKKGDFDEIKLCDIANSGRNKKGTTLKQMIDIYNYIGKFNIYTTFDIIEEEKKQGKKSIEYSKYFNKNFIIKNIESNIPITICVKDWGAHWVNIIGYDDMGTESLYDDVIIVTDSYDVTDHNQDGYRIISALKLLSDFSTGTFFDESDLNDFIFITAVPEKNF